MEIRFDRGILQRPQRQGGVWILEGHAARVHRPGDALRYAHGDEYRDARELQKLTAQLTGLPVTLGHPPGLIKDGAKARVVGRIDSAWVDGEHAAVRATIVDETAIEEIESGTKELSLGYETSLDAGGYQRDTRADHLAIVSSARCGATCSLRTDGVRLDCSCARAEIDRPVTVTEASHMKDDERKDETRLDEIEVLRAQKEQLEKQLSEANALLKINLVTAENEAVKKERERADAAEAKIAKFGDTITERVRERSALLRIGSRRLGASARLDDVSDRHIKELVVKHLDASLDVKALTDSELHGHFLALTRLADRHDQSLQNAGDIMGRTQQPQAPRADEESYDSMMKNAWKTKSRAAAGGR